MLHLSDEVVGEVGGEHFRHKLRSQVLGIRTHRCHHARRDAQTIVHSARGIEQGLLVFLQILVVRAGKTLQCGRQGRGGRIRGLGVHTQYSDQQH